MEKHESRFFVAAGVYTVIFVAIAIGFILLCSWADSRNNTDHTYKGEVIVVAMIRSELKQKVYEYYLKAPGSVYPSDVATALSADSLVVHNIAMELLNEGLLEIGVPAHHKKRKYVPTRRGHGAL